MKWFSLERAMPVLFILGYAIFFAVHVGGLDFNALFDGLAGRLRERPAEHRVALTSARSGLA
jgi:hypothetical protein